MQRELQIATFDPLILIPSCLPACLPQVIVQELVQD